MPVSNAELRILITAQDRAKAVMAGAAETVTRVTQAVQQLGATRGFQTAAQGAQQLGTAINALARGNPLQQMTAGMRSFTQAAAQAATQARQMAQIQMLGGGGGGAQAAVASLSSALSSIQGAFKTAQQTASAAGSSISQSLMAIGNAARGVAGGVAGGLSAAVNGLTSMIGGINSVAGAILNLGRSTTGLTKSSQDVNTFSGSIRSMVALGASIVGFQGMVGLLQRGWEAFTGAAIGFNATLENTHVALTNLLKSEGRAEAFTAQLREMAETTAFEFPDLLKMAQGFIAVGMQAENVIPIMKDVAGVITSVGGTTTEINRVGRALQQILTTGRVQSDEMNQLAEARVPGWAILAEAIQQTGESMESAIGRARKLSEQGKITAADFFNAWQTYSKKHNLRDLAEESVKTFTGAMSNVRDSLRFLVSDATEPLFQSLSTGLQNFSKLLMSAPVRQFALDIGATMKEVTASFAPVGEAFGRIFQGLKTEGVAGALHAVVAEFAGFTSEIGQAGADLMAAYANGMIQGASDLIQGAVDFVAELIASYLIGNSPPPQGPLAGIEEGGAAVGQAWVAGLTSGLAGIEAAVVQVTDAFGNIAGALSLDQAQAAFEGAKGSLTGLASVAEEAEGALRTLNEQQRELDREQSGLTTQVENIKSAYGDQISALEDSIEAIKEQNTEAEKYADLILKQNDAISQQADLRDRAALNELKAAQIAAEGDPVRKAQLTKQLSENKAKQEGLAIAQREQDLDRQARQADEKQTEYAEKMAEWEKKKAQAKKDGKKFETKPPEPPDPKELSIARAKIAADREEVAIKRALYEQTNHAALAQIEADEAAIKSAQALRHAEEERAKMGPLAVKNAAEQERIMKEIEALPLEEQAEALKKAQEEALRPLNQRLEILRQEERQLQAIRKEWQALKADITDAIQAQKSDEAAAKKAAGAAGQGFAGGPMNLDRMEIDVKKAAERVGKSMADGIGKGVQDNIGAIVFGALGAGLGAMAFGPLGIPIGVALGAQVGAAVQKLVPNLMTIFGDMGRSFLQAFAGEWSTDHQGVWVSPIVDAAGRVGIAMRKAADIIASIWRGLAGPVGAASQKIKEHIDLIVTAATGPVAMSMIGLAGRVLSAFNPIIGLLTRITPAMLLVSAGALALKLIWDNAFKGIAETTEGKIEVILQELAKLTGVDISGISGQWDRFVAIVEGVGAKVGAAVDGILGTVARLLGVEVVDGSRWQTLVNIATGVRDGISTIVDNILASLARLLGVEVVDGSKWETFKNVVSGVSSAISSAIDGIITKAGELVGINLDPMNGKLANLQTLFTDLRAKAEEEWSKIRTVLESSEFKANIDVTIKNVADALTMIGTAVAGIAIETLLILTGIDLRPMGEGATEGAKGVRDLSEALLQFSRATANITTLLANIIDIILTLGKVLVQDALIIADTLLLMSKIGDAINKFKAGDIKGAMQAATEAQTEAARLGEDASKIVGDVEGLYRRIEERKKALDKINSDTEQFILRKRALEKPLQEQISDPRDAAGYTGPPPLKLPTVTPDQIAAGTAAGASYGTAITAGIGGGITSGTGAAETALDEFNRNLDESFKDHWQIRSPSAVTMQYGADIIAGFVAGIESGADAFLASFQTIYAQALALVTTWMTEMLAQVTAGITAIIAEITTRVTEIVAGIQDWMDQSLLVFTTGWEAMLTATSEAIQGIWTEITTRGEDIIGGVQLMMDGMLESATTGWQAIWEATMNGLQTMWGAIRNTTADIVGAMRLVLDGIVAMATDWGSAGASLGKTLMDAVISSIQSGLGGLGSMLQMSNPGGGGGFQLMSNKTGSGSLMTSGGPAKSIEEGLAIVAAVARAEKQNDEIIKALQAIVRTEGGLTGKSGDSGRAHGAFQFHEGGELPNFAKWLGVGIEEAKVKAKDVALATQYAIQTYLGDALRQGQAQGLTGPALATHGQRVGQRSITPEVSGANWQNTIVSGDAAILTTAVKNGVTLAMNAGGRMPVVGNALSSSYWTSGGTHGGAPAADIFAPKGSPIYSPVGGTSKPATYEKGGNATIIQGDDGKFYYMAHGNVPFAGGRVEAGQQIGQVGNTGNASTTSPHLHYAIATAKALFDTLNGSGDIAGSPEDWRVGGVGTAVGMAGGKGAELPDPAKMTALQTGLAQVNKLAAQMGVTFTLAGDQATVALTATTTEVQTTGATMEEQSAAASEQTATLVSASTDALGNVTRIYADATGVIGATMTDASGQVVNAWGSMAAAHEAAKAKAAEAAAQTTAFAATLTAGMVPAGAQAGNAIQMMTDNINPLLSEIAAGSLTTDQLVLKLGALALNAGLTSAPLEGLAGKTMTAKDAMLLMLGEAAKVDPQFAAMNEQMLATDASAQTMAVTFAEGVANSVGVASAAVEQMATGVDPLVAAVDSGAISGADLEKVIVQMADAAGLATAPFRQMSDGMIDSNKALKDVIKLSSTVSPEFEALSKEVEGAGTVSEESAKKYLELVKAFKQGTKPADAAATAAEEVGTQVEGAVEPVAALSTTMTEQATIAAEQFSTILTTGMQAGIEGVRALAPEAESAGTEVGTAIVRGLEAGIASAAEAVASKAAEVVRNAIAAAKSEASASSPSKKTEKLGLDLDAGLEVGQLKGSPGVEDAARAVIAGALGAAQDEASAHSPSEETRELGFNLNAGLELGQLDDAKYVEMAARDVVGSALDAMRDEADAHSPAGEGVRIGKDILEGLKKGLSSSNVSDIAKDQIREYIKIAGEFSDEFAKQIDVGVARIQHEIANVERENLAATLAVKDAQEAQERASQGTLAQRQEINALTVQELALQLEIAKTAQSDLDTMNALRDAEAEREALLAGSLESQIKMAELGVQIANIAKEEAQIARQEADIQVERAAIGVQQAAIAVKQAELAQKIAGYAGQQAELELRSAQAAQNSLAIRQQTAAVEAERAKALKGSVDVQLRQAAIGQRNAAIAVEQAKAEQSILPLKQQAAALQREIEKATKGTVDQQQKAIRAEAEQAAKRIELLEIQDKLAKAESGTSGMSQDEINALHAQEAALTSAAESNARQVEIEKLKQTIATAGMREQQVALNDQIATKEEALIPLQNEKALLDAEGQVIGTNLQLAASGYDAQLVKLHDQVAQHDAIALQITNEKATLDAELGVMTAQQGILTAQQTVLAASQGILDARSGVLAAQSGVLSAQVGVLTTQQGIITATNEANAAAMDVQVIKLQAAADVVTKRQQQEQDVLDKLANQKGVIEATTALEAARHQANITLLEEQLYVQESGQRTLERQLEIQQSIANVISTQIALANALKSALEFAGVISDKNDDKDKDKDKGKDKKKKKKKKAMGGSIYADDIVLVGENGPEIIVPPEDGYILNNATTSRLMSALDMVEPRIDRTVRERQTGGTAWGGRPYLVGDGSGVEGFSTWNPGQTPGGSAQPLKIVNATVHYHVHEQQRSGEARVERVVYETLMVALNS